MLDKQGDGTTNYSHTPSDSMTKKRSRIQGDKILYTLVQTGKDKNAYSTEGNTKINSKPTAPAKASSGRRNMCLTRVGEKFGLFLGKNYKGKKKRTHRKGRGAKIHKLERKNGCLPSLGTSYQTGRGGNLYEIRKKERSKASIAGPFTSGSIVSRSAEKNLPRSNNDRVPGEHNNSSYKRGSTGKLSHTLGGKR